ncbi:T9SS type A sorting domain-containing protein [Winogradskyella sp.]|uniref:T9SS type A sorting domain-containing protein n=1 Tax=Winogradskyella sp. TaxID=1883156 RepID=UPI002626B18F|nr:T9SS type A sorting domain-containing protein [Winogradskyella sp.]
MKHPYLIAFLSILFCCSLNSQSDLIGNWYLDHVVKDGVTYPNYFNDMTIFDIEFTNEPGTLSDSFEFSMGHGCEASQGFYTINSDEITISGITTVSFDCSTQAHSQYNTLFFDEFDYDNSSNGSMHGYVISGNTNDEVLTLTNLSGNSLVYKKQQPQGILVSTWWLYQIDIPGNPVINIPETESPNIMFTNNIYPLNPFTPEAHGSGQCNGFFSTYFVSFNGANNISFSNFGQTLIDCFFSPFELVYFQTLSEPSTNFFEFEIVNNGETLILTDLLGTRLIFGDETLSTGDKVTESATISLKQNPIENQIKLLYNEKLLLKDIKYTIYTINGKRIISEALNRDSINASNLNSGVYFISFSENNTIISTLKFVKK